MFNWILSDTKEYLEPFNFVDMPNWIVWNWTVWSFNCVFLIVFSYSIEISETI